VVDVCRREQRILIVDDNRSLAQALAISLRLEDLEVELAADGLTALEVAARFRPAAVLIDLALPLLDGFEVATRLRAFPTFGSPRLVAWTGRCDPRGRAIARASGFDAYLTKPARFEDVRAALFGTFARAALPKMSAH
jgi:DNA-binding response OmpR family regulator